MVKIGGRLCAGAMVIALALAIAACGKDEKDPTGPQDYFRVAEAKLDHDVKQDLDAARKATAKYRDIDVAYADGYVDDGFGCISDPVLGGMGWHLYHDPLHIDPTFDPARPELLIYEPDGKGRKMKLVAVEYEVYQADWLNAGNSEPPTLFGQEFEALVFPGLDPIYGLHVWLFKNNPSGMFSDFNPHVKCPAV